PVRRRVRCSPFPWRLSAPSSPLSPYTTLFRSRATLLCGSRAVSDHPEVCEWVRRASDLGLLGLKRWTISAHSIRAARSLATSMRSEEHTSELQSRENLVCRLLREKKSAASPGR